MHRILVSGNDQQLLESRSALLATTGAAVFWCAPSVACALLEREAFDLIVLCHSMSETEAAGLIANARRHYAKTKIVLLASAFAEDTPLPDLGYDATLQVDPHGLIKLTKDLLEIPEAVFSLTTLQTPAPVRVQ